jgi:DNA-directed RNA polymerase specialized sigma24 family protein
VLEDQSYEQIAEQLRCSPQVARQHVSRGLRNLKRRWEKSA